MDVYLVPTGPDRYDLYCEVADDPASESDEAVDEAPRGFFRRLRERFRTMLAEAEPRGLPGASIERVEFQRAGEGHPLDDVIVRGVMRTGEPAVLEVQVKRTITFSPQRCGL